MICAARAQKHQVLSTAYRLEWKPLPWDDDAPEECERPELLALVAPRDTDPVAKVLAHEQLASVLARTEGCPSSSDARLASPPVTGRIARSPTRCTYRCVGSTTRCSARATS